MRPAVCPHQPRRGVPWVVFEGQNAARPKMASRAGVRVRPASSMSQIAMASRAPRLEYSPKMASSSVSSEAMTVAAEKVIDSPTPGEGVRDRVVGRAAGPEFFPDPEDEEQ